MARINVRNHQTCLTRNAALVKVDTGVTRRDFIKTTAGALGAYLLACIGMLPNTARAAAPIWDRVPDQHWAVGQPVFLDLTEFVQDPDGDQLSLTLEELPLPPGVSFDGRVISGTPTAEFARTRYEVTADDGVAPESRPRAPTGLRVGAE